MSEPLLVTDRRAFARFSAGLLVGLLFGASIVATVLICLQQLPLPSSSDLALGTAVSVAWAILGVLDVTNRTPHAWRQVPQRMLYSLPRGGRLGVVWGFDLGLLATSQKTSSLLWAGLIGALVLDDTVALACFIVVFVLAYWTAIVIAAIRQRGVPSVRSVNDLHRIARHQRVLRRIVGIILLAAGVATLGALALA